MLLKLTAFFALLFLLFCCNSGKNKDNSNSTRKDIFSTDSLKYVLLTKKFPSEGWDFDDIKDIPVYNDEKFSLWTKDTSKFNKIISAFPQFDNPISFEDSSLNEYCPDHEDFIYCYFIFKNSIVCFQEYHHNECIIAFDKVFKLKNRFSFDTLRTFFEKKAIHKQKFNKDLNRNDSIEIKLPYNKFLTIQKGNGLKVKDKYGNIYKTDWYYLKE